MYGEHPNGGMMKIDFRNVNFLQDEFPSIGEIKKKISNCISYNKTFNDLSVRGRF